MENYKTIKELADELGVSKQAIRKHLDKLPPTISVTKNKNTILLDTNAQDFVRNNAKKKTKQVTSNPKHKVTSNFEEESEVTSLERDRIIFLEEQIRIKDKQLQDINTQQSTLQKLLDQQQQLTLQSNKQIEQLQQQLVLTTQAQESEQEQTTEQEDTSETRERTQETKEPTIELQQFNKKWWQFWK